LGIASGVGSALIIGNGSGDFSGLRKRKKMRHRTISFGAQHYGIVLVTQGMMGISHSIQSLDGSDNDCYGGRFLDGVGHCAGLWCGCFEAGVAWVHLR